MSTTSMLPIQHRLSVRSAPIDLALHQFECDFRCHIPAVVVENQDGNAFNPQKMTVSVQPTIKEVIRVGAVPTITTLPILDDVPIKIPTGGGWSLTFPIKIGDECELSFQDMAIDLWWQNGGVQKQPDGVLYRHDIGDAIAEFGVRSVPNVIPNYSTTSAQLRSDDGSVVVDLAMEGIKITAPIVEDYQIFHVFAWLSSWCLARFTVLVPWLAPKLVPVIVTDVLTGPDVGDRLVMLGATVTVKLTPLLAKPPTVTTTLPVVAPVGTFINCCLLSLLRR